ncbi:17865_t:CDS:2 [Racocetra persica]|uniref:17865_t:CDS:1 n=1 Tax=Racocetra persica TaxID=160502 RepID=A0ACA9LW60_9GLOM|nr:17865_t:CDS:2 [Racocetra persica]
MERQRYMIDQEEIERFITHITNQSRNSIGLFVMNISFKDEAAMERCCEDKKKENDNSLNFGDVIIDDLEFTY